MTAIAHKIVLISIADRMVRLGIRWVAFVAACVSASNLGSQAIAQGVDRAGLPVIKSDDLPGEAEERRKYRFEKKGAIVFRRLPDCEVKCDVYQPESDVALPAIIMIHGGAWRHGSKMAMMRHARRVARVGYVVVSINYRLAPKYPWPAQIDDCQYAVRWLKKNAQIYDVDPERIGVFGYSAGGHLAALLGTMGEEHETLFVDGLPDEDQELKEFSPDVCAVAVGGAPCEFSWLDEESVVLNYWMGGSRKSLPEKYRRASPVEYVTADDAPFFIFHGTADMLVPVQSSVDFHETLKAQGVSSTLLTVDGAGHLATFSRAELLKQIIPFFDKHLQHGPQLQTDPTDQ
jgi:triacylglycerol lipase